MADTKCLSTPIRKYLCAFFHCHVVPGAVLIPTVSFYDRTGSSKLKWKCHLGWLTSNKGPKAQKGPAN